MGDVYVYRQWPGCIQVTVVTVKLNTVGWRRENIVRAIGTKLQRLIVVRN
jgi:hypothetical protein